MLRKLLFLTCVTGLFYLAGVGVPSAAMAQQTATITGTVTDAKTGKTLPAANVLLKEIQRGAVTNAQGKYTISNISPGTYTLRITFIGYQTYSSEVTLQAGKNVVNIELKPGAIGLGQLVVTGFQTESVKDLTTAISHVSAKQIQQVPVMNAASALQGRAAGVMVTHTSGTAGSGFRVRVRGTGSITAGSRPLYIVNGVEVSYSGQSEVSDLSPLNGIAPEDIKSISVLKSAAATAIYGAQGANGVVIITTKSGQKGPVQVTASYSRGVRTGINNVNYANTAQWLKFYKMAGNNTWPHIKGAGKNYIRTRLLSGYGLYNGKVISKLPGKKQGTKVGAYTGDLSNLPNFNWFDFVNRSGIVNNFRMSISGGSEQVTYFISGGYNNTQNSIKATSYQNYHLSTKIHYLVSSKFDVKLSLNLSHQKNYGACQDGFYINCPASQVSFLPPVVVPYDKDGSYNQQMGIIGAGNNPALLFDQYVRRTSVVHILGSISASYDFAPWISLKTQFGEDWRNVQDVDYSNVHIAPGTGGDRTYSVTTIPNFNTTTTLNINKSFNDAHNFSALLGFEYRRNFTREISANGQGFPGAFVHVLGTAAVPHGVDGFTQEFRKAGYFANVKYNYKHRYYINLTGRYEGSSRFGRKNRWGFFPAISGAWNISSEKWFNVDWVSTLKLRAGYGKTGNSRIGRYASLGLYQINGQYGGTSGLQPDQLANPELTWESAGQIDIGLDFSLFHGRFSGTIDVYSTNHTRLLLNAPLPHISGYNTVDHGASITQNVGKTNSKGIEFHFSSVNIRTNDFVWRTRFNISIQKNTVKDLVGNTKAVNPGSTVPIHVGHSINALHLVRYAGVNPADGRPFWYDKNGNLTYHPSPEDRVWYDGGEQDAYGGFGTTFQYKGLSLHAFFQYTYGQTASPILVYAFNVTQSSSAFANISVPRLKKSWTHPGQFAVYPYPQVSGFAYPGTAAWVQGYTDSYFSTTYLRLKNITLSYNLPNSITDPLNLDNVELYITGFNLITWTAWPGLDPEVAGNAGTTASVTSTTGTLPSEREIIGGIKIEF